MGRHRTQRRFAPANHHPSMTTANRWPITQFLPAPHIVVAERPTKSSPARSWQKDRRAKPPRPRNITGGLPRVCRALRSSSAQGTPSENLQKSTAIVDFRSERSRQSAASSSKTSTLRWKRNISSPSAKHVIVSQGAITCGKRSAN